MTAQVVCTSCGYEGESTHDTKWDWVLEACSDCGSSRIRYVTEPVRRDPEEFYHGDQFCWTCGFPHEQCGCYAGIERARLRAARRNDG